LFEGGIMNIMSSRIRQWQFPLENKLQTLTRRV